jgi:hypothetical protein
MRIKNKAAFEIGRRRPKAEFDSKLQRIVRPPASAEIRRSAHQPVGFIARIRSILSVETVRSAAIILNELLILGWYALGD